MAPTKQIKIRLVRSTAGRLPSHKDTVRGLGLGKVGSTRTLIDTPEVRGMINKIQYLLSVEAN